MIRSLAPVVLLTMISAAAESQTMLKVHLSDNSPINVSVDGRYFNRRGTSVTVGDLPPGVHTLRIYGGQSSYGRGGSQLVYKGRVSTSMGQKTDFMYDPYGGGISAHDEPMGSYNNQGNLANNNNYQNNQNGETYGDNNQNSRTEISGYAPAPQNNANDVPPAASDVAPTTTNNDMPAASPVIVDEGSMPEARMNKLKTKINAKKTDTEKLKMLKESLKAERITTYQVSVMMDWLSFENSRLDFAKWAYDITTDKDQYSGLGAKFSYKESQTELNDFLQSKH